MHAALSYAQSWDFYAEKQHSNKVLPFGTKGSGNYASLCRNITKVLLHVITLMMTMTDIFHLADSFTRRRPTNHCTMGGGRPDTSTDSAAGRPSARVSGFGSCESSMCGARCSSAASLFLTLAGRVRRIVFDKHGRQLSHVSFIH